MCGDNNQFVAVSNRSRTDAAALQVLQLCEAMGEVETKTRLVNAMTVFETFNEEVDKPFRVSTFTANTQLEKDVMQAKKMLTESWALPETICIAMKNLVAQFDQDVAGRLVAQKNAFKDILYPLDLSYASSVFNKTSYVLPTPNYDC